jgi:hypothetical protein
VISPRCGGRAGSARAAAGSSRASDPASARSPGTRQGEEINPGASHPTSYPQPRIRKPFVHAVLVRVVRADHAGASARRGHSRRRPIGLRSAIQRRGSSPPGSELGATASSLPRAPTTGGTGGGIGSFSPGAASIGVGRQRILLAGPPARNWLRRQRITRRRLSLARRTALRHCVHVREHGYHAHPPRLAFPVWVRGSSLPRCEPSLTAGAALTAGVAVSREDAPLSRPPSPAACCLDAS